MFLELLLLSLTPSMSSSIKFLILEPPGPLLLLLFEVVHALTHAVVSVAPEALLSGGSDPDVGEIGVGENGGGV